MKHLYFETLGSTNTFALENMDELEDKTVITAKHQTGGHGRFQRKWEQAPGENLYITIVLKPQNTRAVSNLTQYLCVVLCRVFDSYGAPCEIKFPNDVLSCGKKIAGILCESKFQGTKAKGFALGAGVNLNVDEKDKQAFPFQSLNFVLEKRVDKEEFIQRLEKTFFEGYEDFLRLGFCSIKEEYVKKCAFLGRKVYLSDLDGKKTAYTAKEITNEGNLIAADYDNQTKKIFSCDMTY